MLVGDSTGARPAAMRRRQTSIPAARDSSRPVCATTRRWRVSLTVLLFSGVGRRVGRRARQGAQTAGSDGSGTRQQRGSRERANRPLPL